MPEVTAELEAIEGNLHDDFAEEEDTDIISSDLFPEDCVISFASFPEDIIKSIEAKPSVWVDMEGIEFENENDKIPVIIIQTTRPKR